jgi:hypothetical protein
MIALLLAHVAQDPDPEAIWYMAAIELLIEAVAAVALVGIVVW